MKASPLHSPRSFHSCASTHHFLDDGLSCDHSAVVVYGLNALHIVIHKLDLLEPFWNPVSCMERVVLCKAYIEENIEATT